MSGERARGRRDGERERVRDLVPQGLPGAEPRRAARRRRARRRPQRQREAHVDPVFIRARRRRRHSSNASRRVAGSLVRPRRRVNCGIHLRCQLAEYRCGALQRGGMHGPVCCGQVQHWDRRGEADRGTSVSRLLPDQVREIQRRNRPGKNALVDARALRSDHPLRHTNGGSMETGVPVAGGRVRKLQPYAYLRSMGHIEDIVPLWRLLCRTASLLSVQNEIKKKYIRMF
mmetsp:Transcript_23683/g.59819  ORF Transcript_23683/g.59819 Transcript_23683/m.59819 type:complete len:230 (+) Transcript_23683:1103-1792(+)